MYSNYGIDIYDPQNEFFNDICYPYAEDSDMLLSERRIKYYQNVSLCESNCIYEGIDYDKQLFYGRTQYDAPEVDCKVYFSSDFAVDIGEMYKVKIDKVKDMDCFGKTIIQED